MPSDHVLGLLDPVNDDQKACNILSGLFLMSLPFQNLSPFSFLTKNNAKKR